MRTSGVHRGANLTDYELCDVSVKEILPKVNNPNYLQTAQSGPGWDCAVVLPHMITPVFGESANGSQRGTPCAYHQMSSFFSEMFYIIFLFYDT